MRRALVTGARGFIGSRVAIELARRGYTVDGMGNGERPQNVEIWISGDIAEMTLPDVNYSVVIHCAGGSSVARSFDDPDGQHLKTVPTTRALLAWIGDTRMVYVSSGAVYGAAKTLPISEDAPLAPVSPYGEHKVECEELCRKHGNVAIVRLFSVYGAGLDRQLLWDAARKARAGLPRFAGSGNERRDWLHVSDAARLLVDAAESSTTQTLNGGSGEGTRVADIVRILLAELGATEAPIFDGTTRAGDPPDYIADITRARALGWAPQVPLGRGIAEYAHWFASR